MANRLRTDTGFVVGGSLSVVGALTEEATLTVTGSIGLNTVAGVSGITFGGDTTLFREAANTLATGQNFLVGGSLTVNGTPRDVATLTVTGSISLNTALGDGGITFDGDMTLFRSAANTLSTGQDFVVGRDLTVVGDSTFASSTVNSLNITGSGVATTSASLTVTGSISLSPVNGISGITFSGDTTLFREAASTLATGQNFLVGGSLTVNGALRDAATLTVTGSISLNTALDDGGITFDGDTSLFRSAANTLRTGHDLSVGRDLTVDRTLTVSGGLTGNPTLTVTGSISINSALGEAGITFGGDTTLFRSAPSTLSTGRNFVVGGSLALNLISGATDSGITFGFDTNLYRTVAQRLRTDTGFVVGGSLSLVGALTTEPTLTVTGSISLDIVAGTAGITLGGDTTLFRERANTLATGQDFVVGGSLTVNGALRGAATLTVTGSISLNSALGDGGITFDGDTTLFRSAASTLATGQNFLVGGSLTVNGALRDVATLTVTGSISLNTALGNGGITFDGDTTLFRSAANALQTGQDFVVGRDLTVRGGSLGLPGTSGADSGITFGTDGNVNLYRQTASGVRQLRTDANLFVVGSLTVAGGAVADGHAINIQVGGLGRGLIIGAPITMALDLIGTSTLEGSGGAIAGGIRFGLDTNLFREASNVLRTGADDSFIVGASLTLVSTTGGLSITQTNGATDSGITFAGDTNLYRSAQNTLRTDVGFVVGGSLVVSGANTLDPTLTVTGSINLNTVNGNSGITFGGDTTLFRSAPNTLATGQTFTVGGSLLVTGSLVNSATLTVTGSVSLEPVNGTSGITFGGDTSLFRSAANTLRTGQDFVVGRDLTVDRTLTVSGGLTGSPTLTVTGSISLETVNGTSGITFGGDTTLFRSAPNTLATGQTFTVGGSLLVTGSLVNSATLTVTGSLSLETVNGTSGITFGEDTSLFRSAANTLRTGQDLSVGRDLTADRTLTVSRRADGQPGVNGNRKHQSGRR